ncbi:MAG: hypothetical protein IGQ45_13605 [Cyanobacterium sp. T60_A2020_053]|nr:hypothetical protein [Cyanobacterium sp. T60_A2020_053]
MNTIKTNRLKITFNIDKIKEDFIFLRLERQTADKKWIGAKQLDFLISDDYKALAVCYTAQYAYAMFSSDNNGYELRHKIPQDTKKFGDVTVKEVKPKNSNNDSVEYFVFGEALARLLLNYLGYANSKFDSLNFSNLTGCLLKVPSLGSNKKSQSIEVAQVKLDYINNSDKEYLLNVSISTYRLKKQFKKSFNTPLYFIDKSNNTLKRWLDDDSKADPKTTYIKAGLYNKKAHRDFIKFKDLNEFQESRAGIIYEVYQKIKNKLNKYVDVKFVEIGIDKSIKLNDKTFILKDAKNLQSILNNQRVNIVDLVNDDKSESLVNSLQNKLSSYFNNPQLISNSSEDIEGIFNIRIIHDAEFYHNNNLNDPHLRLNDDTFRQHITIESSNKISDAMVKTVIKELIIKKDIKNKKISLFDWQKMLNINFDNACNSSEEQSNTQLNIFELNKKWVFAMYKDENKDDSPLTFMTINSDGSFEFEEINNQSIFPEDHRYEDYQNHIKQIKDKEEKNKSSFKFEGFMLSDGGDINLIFRSDEITLPDLEKINSTLTEVSKKLPENLANGLKMSKIAKEFLAENEQLNKDKFALFCQQLENHYSHDLPKDKLYEFMQKYLGSGTKCDTSEGKGFRNYLLEKYQIRFILTKDKENINSLFASSLNINYFGETDKEAYYFVGNTEGSIKHSFKDSCHLRKVVAVENCRLIFRDLLKTMDVDFVRTGQSTVIPFPFKYIREYQNFT